MVVGGDVIHAFVYGELSHLFPVATKVHGVEFVNLYGAQEIYGIGRVTATSARIDGEEGNIDMCGVLGQMASDGAFVILGASGMIDCAAVGQSYEES